MTILETSKYLRRVVHRDGVLVYHSLFGNLALVDQAGSELLDFFNCGGTTSGAYQRFPDLEKVDIIQYINLLLQRNFLVQTGHDEYLLLQLDRQRKKENLASGYLVRALQLVLTNKCNFSCSYCFTKSIYGSDERTALQCRPSNMKMDFGVARHALDGLLALARKNGHPEVFVELFGGEPLMNWDVIKDILVTYGNGLDDGVTINYSITTNGSLLNTEMAELFARYGVSVTVSVNSASIARNEKGDRVLLGVALLGEMGNRVTINSVISGQTMDTFNSRCLVDFAVAHGVGMIGLILELDPVFYTIPSNLDAAYEILWETSRYGRHLNMPIVGYWQQIYQQIIGQQPINLVSGYKTCPATGCKLSVEPAGDIFACKCCSERIGSIVDIGAVFRSPRYEAYALKAYRASPECALCEIEGFCGGICMGVLERGQKNNNARPDGGGSCELYKRITRKLIEETDSKELDRLCLGEMRNVKVDG